METLLTEAGERVPSVKVSQAVPIAEHVRHRIEHTRMSTNQVENGRGHVLDVTRATRSIDAGGSSFECLTQGTEQAVIRNVEQQHVPVTIERRTFCSRESVHRFVNVIDTEFMQ